MWIETITVRTARPEQCALLLEELMDFQAKGGIAGAERFGCYRNLDVENELCIHLAWAEPPGKNRPPAKTDCGLKIARRFARFGLVHHTLWRPGMGNLWGEGTLADRRRGDSSQDRQNGS